MASSPRESFWPRALGNEIGIAAWSTDRGIEPFVDPIHLLPYDNRSWFAPKFGDWYSSRGQRGERPGGDLARAQETRKR